MTLPWYVIAALVCAAIAPFDALYMYIKNEKRKEARKDKEKTAHSSTRRPQENTRS